MNLIMQWITQIIIFLLVANIIDLLIPKTTMKKYVKLVLGLILLLIFLRPVFYLFTIDINSELNRSIMQHDEASTDLNALENMTELEIKDIQASQDAYILEQLTSQLKKIAEPTLIERFDAEIGEIDYVFVTNEKMNYENLAELVVTVHPKDQLEGAVKSVEEIRILNPDETVKQEEDIPDYLKDIEEILREIWEIGDVDLIMKWKGETS